MMKFYAKVLKYIFTNVSLILPVVKRTFVQKNIDHHTKSYNFFYSLVLALLLLAVGSVNATTYYSWTNAAPNSLNSWWTGTNGTGSHPGDFITVGDVFIVQHNNTMTLSNSWTVTGNLVINDGCTFVANNNTLTISGTTTVGGGASGTLSITSTTGNKTFTGAVTINNGATFSESVPELITFGSDVTNNGTLTANGNATISIAGNFTNNGTFNQATSTVTFNGSSAQIIAGTKPTTFNNLTINEAAAATTVTNTSKAFTVSNVLTVTQGNLILQATDANYIVSGDLTVSPTNGTLTHSVSWDTYNKLLQVGGNLTIDGNFVYTVRSHVQMTGSGKTIRTGTAALSILTLATAGTITANGDVTVNDNFWAFAGVTGGTFVTGTNTITANAAILNNGGTININGGTVNVTGGGLNVGTTSYGGTVNFSAGTLNADNITVGDGTRTGTFNHSGGTVNISGDLTISNTGTYTCTNSPAINVGGNWINNKTFSASTSTVTMTGSGKTIGGSSASTFNNLTLSGTASVSTAASVSVGGDLYIGDGTTFNAAANNTLTVSGTTTVGGGTSGTFIISAYNSAPVLQGSVTINAGGIWKNTANSPVNYQNGLANYGTFIPGTQTQTFSSNSQSLTGTIDMTGAPITITGITLTNNGTLTVTGNFGGTGTLTNASTGTVNTTAGITISTLINQGTLYASSNNLTPGILTNASTGILNISGSAYAAPTSTFTNQGTLNYTSSANINSVTNTGTINVQSSGYIGGITNSTGGTLNISALSYQINSLTANAAGNTVNYSGSGAQTIINTTYSNLTISGSGTKTVTSSFSVGNNLSITAGTATLNSGVNISTNTLTLGTTSSAIGTYGSSTSSATNKNDAYFVGSGIVTVTNAVCPYGNTLNGTITPVIDMPSYVNTVSNNFSSGQYFVMNVIKGLTYQIYTNNSPTNANALKMVVYEEGKPSGSALASSFANTGSSVGNTNDVFLSFTSPLSGQVRVLINSRTNCSLTSITGLKVYAIVSAGSNTQDDPTVAGSDAWIGQVYDGFSFNNYIGNYNVTSLSGKTDQFQELFYPSGGTWPAINGDDTHGFNVSSNGVVRAQVLDQTFSVHYRMNSTKSGFYTVSIASDDGVRLMVDNTKVYEDWTTHAPKVDDTQLISLSGSSSLLLDYNEQNAQNVIGFYNLTQIFTNALTTNTTQVLCKGTPGSTISGDAIGVLPTGISLVGYQWYYSTTPTGTGTLISGANAATFAPPTSAPFNVAGMYYVYRVTTLKSTVNYGVANPTNMTNKSNVATVRIKGCPNNWIGGAAPVSTTWNTSTDWNTASNWSDGVPYPGDDIAFSTTATNNLVLDNNYTVGNFTNQSGKQLIIAPATSLTANGVITTTANNNNQIYIQSSQSAPTLPSGSLIFHNDPVSQPVYATVEMYSKAKKATSTPPTVDGAQDWYSWQYFGVPIDPDVVADPTFAGSYLQKQNEMGDYDNKWSELGNSDHLQAFTGYAITQDNPITIVFSGQLVNRNNTYTLPYSSPVTSPNTYFRGQSLLANPYTAAINVGQLVFGANTEQTVYLYNTGSYGEWYTNAGSSGTNNGQYLAIPYSAAPVGSLTNTIPSMSGFMVNATDPSGGSLTINYNNVAVMNTGPQRAPAANKAASSDKTYIEIALNGEHTSDRMWLIDQPGTTHGFDNGWDGYKYSGALGTPMLFAMEETGNYQVSTSDNLNNTYLGFQAGVDVEDTLTFTHANIALKYDGLYLVDLVENKVVDISTSGTQYAFKAESTASPVKRFKIVTEPYVKDAADLNTQLKVFNDNATVFVDNQSNEKGELYFYDMMGRYLKKEIFSPNSISSFSVISKSGAYVVKAVTASEKVSKRIIVNYQSE